MADQLPAAGSSFHIEFGSLAKGTFTSCSGLTSKISVVEHKGSAAQGKPVLQRLAGPLEGGEITLKRAVVPGEKQFSDWANKASKGDPSSRVNGTVTVLTIDGKTVATFTLTNAWASGYTLGDLVAGNNSLLEETLTITHEGCQVK
jgi:phage tail-like protein